MALAGVGLVFLHTAGSSTHRAMAREEGQVALAGVGLVFLHTAGSYWLGWDWSSFIQQVVPPTEPWWGRRVKWLWLGWDWSSFIQQKYLYTSYSSRMGLGSIFHFILWKLFF